MYRCESSVFIHNVYAYFSSSPYTLLLLDLKKTDRETTLYSYRSNKVGSTENLFFSLIYQHTISYK